MTVLHKPAHLKGKQRAFIESLRVAGNVTLACQSAEVPRRTFYYWAEHDEAFGLALAVAREEAADLLEEAARTRAVDGVVKETPIFHNGTPVGSVVETKYSDTLLIFLLKGLRPEKYRERASVDHSGTLTHQVQIREIVIERPQVAGDSRS